MCLQTVDEMLRVDGPDWQRVLGYVESIYRHFEMWCLCLCQDVSKKHQVFGGFPLLNVAISLIRTTTEAWMTWWERNGQDWCETFVWFAPSWLYVGATCLKGRATVFGQYYYMTRRMSDSPWSDFFQLGLCKKRRLLACFMCLVCDVLW